MTQIGPALLAWHATDGRHDLPWQQDRSAYRVWISEVMLQQTQVATVIPYFERFMARFPTVRSLAEAPQDEVLHLWSGLGYYARARNLQRAAQIIVAEHGGEFPRDFAAVEALPGIGRSTAGAILSISDGQHYAILDGNVRRVLARVFGVEGRPGERAFEDALWRIAEAQTPAADAGRYAQAIMDLGATLCVRGKPDCARCPFAADCVANVTGRQKELPTSRPKKTVPTRKTWMLVLQDGNSVLLEKRPLTGIWGGLWSLPEAQDENALAAVSHSFGGSAELQRLTPFTHTFTHFKLDIEPRLGRANGVPDAADSKTVWAPLANIDAYGVPAPVRKLLDALQGSLI